ncbi:hypothetical protein LUX57_02250 [Actinomadura madurae]|nr:hypothetical protein [Actinomadura madurae]
MASDHITEITVFAVLFLLVSGMGFVAARWRRPDTMHNLDEWGLGGRSFGSWITWFLIGGDLYTAYTFVAVPALVFGAGAAGFFAVPYTIVVYPLVFLVLIRLWSVSHVHGFVTPADFVRARFGSPTLALVVAITGIVATMPYIALQLVGIEAVLKAMGVNGHWPIIIAFVILAAYTYQSGLRAPALIAFVKDLLIYLVIIVAVLYIPAKLGGWGDIFDAAKDKFDKTPAPGDGITIAGQRPAELRHARARLGDGPVPVPAQRHRRAGQQEPQRDQAEHGGAARLQPRARPDRAARLHGHRRRRDARQYRRQGRHQHRGPGAVRPHVPGLVRRRGVRRRRHRRAGPGGDHVDRGGQPVHPQHLQGVHPPRRRREGGGDRQQAGLADRQGRRGGVHPRARPRVLDRPAAHRRRHHPADAAVGGARADDALVPPRRAHRRAGPAAWPRACGCCTRSRTRRRARSTSAARPTR